jgi:hypothetical protein
MILRRLHSAKNVSTAERRLADVERSRPHLLLDVLRLQVPVIRSETDVHVLSCMMKLRGQEHESTQELRPQVPCRDRWQTCTD